MNFYWLYNIPSWQLFLIICGSTVGISLFGSLMMRGRMERRLGLSEEQNDLIGHFLSFTGIFYGIMLGLIAVGAWDTFNNTQDKVNSEAAAMSAFYRDVSHLPEPASSQLKTIMGDYTRFIIDHAWGYQQQGITPGGGNLFTNKIADILYGIEPENPREEVILSEAIGQFNDMLTARRLRLQSINEGLPASLWFVIVLGTVLNIVLTWLLVIKNRWLDITVNLVVSVLLGSLLFFIVAMDNPFRGELSVTADAYEQIYQAQMR